MPQTCAGRRRPPTRTLHVPHTPRASSSLGARDTLPVSLGPHPPPLTLPPFWVRIWLFTPSLSLLARLSPLWTLSLVATHTLICYGCAAATKPYSPTNSVAVCMYGPDRLTRTYSVSLRGFLGSWWITVAVISLRLRSTLLPAQYIALQQTPLEVFG